MWFCAGEFPQVECPDCLKHYVPPKEEEKGDTVDPDAPEICEKCKDRKVERKEAIIELVQTEINYGNDLQILKEVRYQLLLNSQPRIERFSIECRKAKTRVITLANHKGHR